MPIVRRWRSNVNPREEYGHVIENGVDLGVQILDSPNPADIGQFKGATEGRLGTANFQTAQNQAKGQADYVASPYTPGGRMRVLRTRAQDEPNVAARIAQIFQQRGSYGGSVNPGELRGIDPAALQEAIRLAGQPQYSGTQPSTPGQPAPNFQSITGEQQYVAPGAEPTLGQAPQQEPGFLGGLVQKGKDFLSTTAAGALLGIEPAYEPTQEELLQRGLGGVVGAARFGQVALSTGQAQALRGAVTSFAGKVERKLLTEAGRREALEGLYRTFGRDNVRAQLSMTADDVVKGIGSTIDDLVNGIAPEGQKAATGVVDKVPTGSQINTVKAAIIQRIAGNTAAGTPRIKSMGILGKAAITIFLLNQLYQGYSNFAVGKSMTEDTAKDVPDRAQFAVGLYQDAGDIAGLDELEKDINDFNELVNDRNWLQRNVPGYNVQYVSKPAAEIYSKNLKRSIENAKKIIQEGTISSQQFEESKEQQRQADLAATIAESRAKAEFYGTPEDDLALVEAKMMLEQMRQQTQALYAQQEQDPGRGLDLARAFG